MDKEVRGTCSHCLKPIYSNEICMSSKSDLSMLHINCYENPNLSKTGIEDHLIIGYDKAAGEDNSSLIVSRQTITKGIIIINDYFGEEANEMYNKLIGTKED